MLSGLIDTATRNNEKHCNIQTTRVIRLVYRNITIIIKTINGLNNCYKAYTYS